MSSSSDSDTDEEEKQRLQESVSGYNIASMSIHIIKI